MELLLGDVVLYFLCLESRAHSGRSHLGFCGWDVSCIETTLVFSRGPGPNTGVAGA